jgi:predicted metal-dependent phosphoesterase TrpH
MNSTIDLHLHTLVSDGNATPLEMLRAAKEAGLEKISFTDHDALGAYKHWGDLFAPARELGIEIVSGIELDTYFPGPNQKFLEIHLLGYGFQIDDKALNRHLGHTQRMRKQKVQLQLAIINRFFGRKVVEPKKVLIPFRDTMMKPHLVHSMLDQGLFSDYREAAHWLSEIARVPIRVPQLPLQDAIAMVRRAGGEAILAHPGYMVKETDVSLPSFLEELIPLGLAGLEVDYPYFQEKEPGSPFLDRASEQAMIAELRSLAGRFNLKMTRGSDAHTVEALGDFAKRG